MFEAFRAISSLWLVAWSECFCFILADSWVVVAPVFYWNYFTLLLILTLGPDRLFIITIICNHVFKSSNEKWVLARLQKKTENHRNHWSATRSICSFLWSILGIHLLCFIQLLGNNSQLLRSKWPWGQTLQNFRVNLILALYFGASISAPCVIEGPLLKFLHLAKVKRALLRSDSGFRSEPRRRMHHFYGLNQAGWLISRVTIFHLRPRKGGLSWRTLKI